MECPHCGSELDYDDTFGRHLGRDGEVILGYIYRCPLGRSESEDCDSSMFSVAGSFYTYTSENESTLHEGYPC